MRKTSLKALDAAARDMEPYEALAYIESHRDEFGSSINKLIEKYTRRKIAYENEMARLDKMSIFEKQAYASGCRFIAGADEAGRGPLAGPVVAAAVILPEGIRIEGLNDSKQLNAKQRDKLYDIITNKAIAYATGIVDEKCIDEINILNATRMAIRLAVQSLQVKPDLLLIDAVRIDNMEIPQLNIVKGDCKSISIAAASIIAKVTRDRIIEKMDALYPQYGFSKHKGYGTAEHINAIKKYGICPIHRVSFTKNFI